MALLVGVVACVDVGVVLVGIVALVLVVSPVEHFSNLPDELVHFALHLFHSVV